MGKNLLLPTTAQKVKVELCTNFLVQFTSVGMNSFYIVQCRKCDRCANLPFSLYKKIGPTKETNVLTLIYLILLQTNFG